MFHYVNVEVHALQLEHSAPANGGEMLLKVSMRSKRDEAPHC